MEITADASLLTLADLEDFLLKTVAGGDFLAQLFIGAAQSGSPLVNERTEQYISRTGLLHRFNRKRSSKSASGQRVRSAPTLEISVRRAMVGSIS